MVEYLKAQLIDEALKRIVSHFLIPHLLAIQLEFDALIFERE